MRQYSGILVDIGTLICVGGASMVQKQWNVKRKSVTEGNNSECAKWRERVWTDERTNERTEGRKEGRTNEIDIAIPMATTSVSSVQEYIRTLFVSPLSLSLYATPSQGRHVTAKYLPLQPFSSHLIPNVSLFTISWIGFCPEESNRV